MTQENRIPNTGQWVLLQTPPPEFWHGMYDHEWKMYFDRKWYFVLASNLIVGCTRRFTKEGDTLYDDVTGETSVFPAHDYALLTLRGNPVGVNVRAPEAVLDISDTLPEGEIEGPVVPDAAEIRNDPPDEDPYYNDDDNQEDEDSDSG